jgi:HSP20 family molecular chaperone IbpA
MSMKASWGVAVLLGFVAVAEGGYILSHRAAASTQPAEPAARPAAEEISRWDRQLRDEIARAGKLGDKDFDALFGDDFFRRRVDPFAEIDRVRRRLEEGLDATDRTLFRDSFKDWFTKRIDLGPITTKVSDEGRNILVTFGIPGLDVDSVKLDVNANRIRLRYEAREEATKGGTDVESATSVEKVVPLPAGADPAGFDVRKGKDSIILVFHRAGHAA